MVLVSSPKEYLLEPYISRSKKDLGWFSGIKKIMEDHKGNIELKNNYKEGAKVTLLFPFKLRIGLHE